MRARHLSVGHLTLMGGDGTAGQSLAEEREMLTPAELARRAEALSCADPGLAAALHLARSRRMKVERPPETPPIRSFLGRCWGFL